MNFFIKIIILLNVAHIVSSSQGKRLGEQCDYKRLCQDKNAECAGQMIPGEFLKAPEKPNRYVCECKQNYWEKDGVCQEGNVLAIVIAVVIAAIFFLIVITVKAFIWFKKKAKNGQTDLQEEQTDLKEEQASIIIPENSLPNEKEQYTCSSYALLCHVPLVKMLKAFIWFKKKAKNGQMDLQEEQTDLKEEQASIIIPENSLPYEKEQYTCFSYAMHYLVPDVKRQKVCTTERTELTLSIIREGSRVK